MVFTVAAVLQCPNIAMVFQCTNIVMVFNTSLQDVPQEERRHVQIVQHKRHKAIYMFYCGVYIDALRVSNLLSTVSI